MIRDFHFKCILDLVYLTYNGGYWGILQKATIAFLGLQHATIAWPQVQLATITKGLIATLQQLAAGIYNN